MRIAAMAAGAVGGYFGARLAAAGHDVFFIARGAHRDAIAKNGLKVESVHGDLHLPKVNTRVITPRESWVDDANMRQKVAAEGNAAILGVGL